MKKSTTVLITGAGGQLGLSLKKESPQYRHFDFHFYESAELDITDANAFRKTCEQVKPDVIVNCAAYTAVDLAETEVEKASAINNAALGPIAQTCGELDILLVHISSDYVYHSIFGRPIKESDVTSPKGIYAVSKREGEKKIVSAGCSYLIIRTSWVFSEFGNNFVKTMLRLFKEKESLNIVEDQIGSPTYAVDLANLILAIIPPTLKNKDLQGIYNFSNLGQTSWFAFAKEMANRLSSPIEINPIPSKNYPTPASRPPWSVMSKEKIQSSFGVKITTWEDSLSKCLVELFNKK